jgi:hypothetical protein
MAIEYARWFINRRAYTLQFSYPHPASGHHYYYRPRRRGNPTELTPRNIQRHLMGEITLGIYAINPRTQRVKWMAIDADYRKALEGPAQAPVRARAERNSGSVRAEPARRASVDLL